jgi:hypothetical protein
MNGTIVAVMLGMLLTSFAAPYSTFEKEHAMSQYMLILHETPSDFAGYSAEDLNRVIAEYVAWRHKLEAEGRFAGGNKLADEGGRRLALVDGNVRVTDGPYAEAKEVVGGYFIVSAADYDEAIAIARTCPHLKYGGTIDLRLVEAVSDAASAGH